MWTILYMIAPLLGVALSISWYRSKYYKSKYYKITELKFLKVVLNKGNYGEYSITKYLEKMGLGDRLLVNMYVPKDDGTFTEVDVAFIHNTGIYVLESKNYGGTIYGDHKRKNWIQYMGGNKFTFYSPTRQNYGHIKGLEEYLKDVSEDMFKSWIIFSERCNLKPIKNLPSNVKVIKRSELRRELKYEIKQTRDMWDDSVSEELYNKLIPLCKVSEDVKKEHIENVKSKMKQ